MINKQIGSSVCFTGGADPSTPIVSVVKSTYHGADLGDRNIQIETVIVGGAMHGGRQVIELSEETLRTILRWANEK